METDTRNVQDYYKYWTTEAIKADLDTKRNNFIVLCANVQGDFNLSTVVRNSNAFLAKEVWIYGKKQYDRRGTVGTHHYTNFRHVKNIDSVLAEINEVKATVDTPVHIVGIDNIEDSTPINQYAWNHNHMTIMVLGEEGTGIPEELLNLCEATLYIPQFGSVRSLNVGTASGIAMYDYCTSYGK